MAERVCSNLTWKHIHSLILMTFSFGSPTTFASFPTFLSSGSPWHLVRIPSILFYFQALSHQAFTGFQGLTGYGKCRHSTSLLTLNPPLPFLQPPVFSVLVSASRAPHSQATILMPILAPYCPANPTFFVKCLFHYLLSQLVVCQSVNKNISSGLRELAQNPGSL